MSRSTAAVVVFAAAAAVLVLEILALRMLAPYVGLTLQTSTTVIGVVLAGIACGAGAGGALADRIDPRVLLAWALVAGGLLTMATVPIVRVLGDALEGAQAAAALPVALAALFLPAAVLSVVTPATAKLQLGSLTVAGSVVGRLSAWATAGALAGTFTAGYVLVPLAPTVPTVLVIGAALVVAGLAAALRLRMAGTTAVLVVAGLAAVAVAAPVALGQRCDVESAYHCADVRADPRRASGRLLVLDGVPNSYVDLKDPRHLQLDYARWLAPALGRARDAVFIGGGGFTLPRYLAAVRPASRSVVLEVDGELVELARSRLGLGDVPGMRVRTGDARMTLRRERDRSADLVVGDAFGGPVVPWHLTTREFLADVRRVLRPGGVYAINVIDLGPQRLARAEAATLVDSFADVAVVRRPRAGGGGRNLVLLASDRALSPRELPPARDGVEVLRGDAVRRFAGDAPVLRDDYAPADQLLTPLP